MRARHRHFNPRDAGAGLVLDARFINQSDNTEVSSWADRSGNARNADQSTSTRRPTFQTAECGGNGVVSFDGSNDELVLTSNIASVDTALFVAKERQAAPAGQNNIQYLLGGSGLGVLTSHNINPSKGVGIFDGTNARVATFATGGIRDNYAIATVGRSNVYKNSTEASYTDTQTANAYTISTVGSRTSQVFPSYCDVGAISLFTASLTDALRRRIERSAGFAWKISCN